MQLLRTHFSQAIVFLSALVFFTLVYAPQSVSAQQAGVSIKPAMFEETVDPGDSNIYSVSIENLDSTEQTYYLFTRNIRTVVEGGRPIFAEDNEQTGYEISDWITLEATEITVAPGASAAVSFNMNVPESATPGSHFGGVFISVDPPEIRNSGAAIGYQVASILSMRVSGDVVEMADIREFSTSKYIYGSQNVEFTVRIENSGNVLVRPTGPLEVFNMLGNKVGMLTFNENQNAVFPGNTREYGNIVWTGDSIGFGRYEAIVSPVYGDVGAKKTMSSTVTFWIMPWSIIGPALGVLATILLFVFVIVRVYIKRSLAHMGHGRRIVRQRRKGGSSAAMLVLVVSLTVTAIFLIILLALFA